MSTKKPTLTLLQTAAKKEPEGIQTAAMIPSPASSAGVEGRSPYTQLLENMPGDPDHKAFLLEQLETSRSWGNSVVRIETDLLLAILERALRA